MSELREKIFDIITISIQSSIVRKKWLAQEVAELGLKYDGLDDLPLDSILLLSALFAKGALSEGELSKLTKIISPNLSDCIDTLSECSFVNVCQASGNFLLTDKGDSACHDIFNSVVRRKRSEIKRDLESIEGMFSKLQEL